MDLESTDPGFIEQIWNSAEPIANALLAVLMSPLGSTHHFYWVFVLSSTAFAAVIYLRNRAPSSEERPGVLRGFARFCFPESVWKNPSAWLDIRFFFVSQTVLILSQPILVFGSLGVITMSVSADWVTTLFDTPPLSSEPSTTVSTLYSLAILMILDFGSFAAHWCQHRVPILWEFHKVHHSAPVMHPVTNYREHPLDFVSYRLVRVLITGVVSGTLAGLMGINALNIDFIRMAGFYFAFNLVAYHLRHSHIWLAWPPWLGRILGSPANHQYHHSREARHINKNFGFMFALWDWVFGTLYLPREREEFLIGLSDEDDGDYDNIFDLYVTPFRKLFRSVAAKKPREG